MTLDPKSHDLDPPVSLADDWWQAGVVYQIYPRSFADSTGDGVGDLPGITAHLDHLGSAGLGVDAIWLSPIYPSPGRDLGYDVSDHAAIDPLFGSMADFEALVAAAHRRGIRVVLDLVMNHTSDQHPWFRASRDDPTGPYGDWYLWRDPAGRDARGRPRPPNNWLSWFGGSGWTWDEGRGQFYFHTFLAEQPDLNWRNPAVPDAQLAMVRGWLDRGVDGFRLDVFNTFYKHADFIANPSAGLHRQAWDRQRHVHDQNQPELVAFLARFRAEVDARPGRMTVGELFGGGAETAASFAADRHLIFDFVLLERPWSAAAFGAAIERVERAFGPVRWPTVVLSNHDQPRHASRLARALGDEHRDAVAKAAAVILLTLRGTPFLYYGEELGLGDIAVRREEAIDPPARRASLFFPWWNRDGCRSPMPWTGEPNAGFTSPGVRTWLPLVPDAGTRNVATQAADPDSVLATYRRLLATRRSLRALRTGTFRRVGTDQGDVLAWIRAAAGDEVLVVVNFAPRPVAVVLGAEAGRGGWVRVDGTHREPGPPIDAGRHLSLRPLEAVIATRRG
ncbi:MAG TPA: alpha-glucosidase [Candidatus Limnocylindrales bacterium]|nr:alpha-glucosidase [Candidatus Limnocylindrales bacterium]